MLLERRCAGCANPGRAICVVCRDRLERCRLDPARSGFDRFAAINNLDGFLAAFDYGELSRRLLLAAKNRGRLDVLGQLATAMTDHGASSDLGDVDVVSWVPSSRHRRRQRGYDQGRILARHVARSMAIPARRLIVRADGDSQAGLDRAQRLIGPRLSAPRSVSGRVLIVDDVATTGASLASTAAALREAGADAVWARVVARADGQRPRDHDLAATGIVGNLG